MEPIPAKAMRRRRFLSVPRSVGLCTNCLSVLSLNSEMFPFGKTTVCAKTSFSADFVVGATGIEPVNPPVRKGVLIGSRLSSGKHYKLDYRRPVARFIARFDTQCCSCIRNSSASETASFGRAFSALLAVLQSAAGPERFQTVRDFLRRFSSAQIGSRGLARVIGFPGRAFDVAA